MKELLRVQGWAEKLIIARERSMYGAAMGA